MSNPRRKPIIGVPVNIGYLMERSNPFHVASHGYVTAVADGAGGTPFLIPALGEALDFAGVVDAIDGLVLTGGRANVEPHHYGGPPFPEDEIRDPARDATVLPLIEACLDAGVPIFGICRGIQEINVALGGTLHYRVHLLEGKLDHRMPQGSEGEQRFSNSHLLALSPDGYLAEISGLTECTVNSLHGQGIDRLASGMRVEAVAPDGLIEAVAVTEAKTFSVGVQWHAERGFDTHDLGTALFREFGAAALARARAKTGADIQES